jgi:hypothetical protein
MERSSSEDCALIYKTGQWKEAQRSINKTPAATKQMQENMQRVLPIRFLNGIRGEIVTHAVRPPLKQISTGEHAGAINLEKDDNDTTVGIPTDKKIRGFDVGKFSIDAEYGVYGAPYMGVWRRFTDQFEKEIDSEAGVQLDKMGL